MNSFQNEELRALHRKRLNPKGLVFSSGDWNRAKHLLNPSVSPCLRRAPCLRRRLWGWREAGSASPCWGDCPHGILERKTEAFIGEIWYTVARDLMTYDTTGKRIRTENLAGQATTTAWDCCHKVYADGKGPKYEYDVHGQLAKRTWARGIDTFYAYDGWGNLTNTTYSDTTPTIALSYDALGRQTSAIDAAGTTIFSYDAFGANTNETVVGVAGTNILERFHDTFGRDAGYALNGVRQSALGYDPATGRLATMLAAGSDTPFAWNYVAGSDLKSSLIYPNGLIASWTYGNRGELLEVDNALPSGSVSKYVYTYDAVGRRIGLWMNGDTSITMSYDRMGRRVTKNDQRFVYNGYLQFADNNGQAYVWDPSENVATRPLKWNHGSRVAYFTHDGNKNVSEVISVDSTLFAHYEYAPFGTLTVSRGTSAADNRWRFSSEYAEDDMATVYYNYRHYEQVAGRWGV